ncbi:MAG: pyridoxamine 5'-phosphate oxidase family protein [Clostridiales Family XIII bacterium]|nr:pyridoxamine 5'-phosphate oxidase family protein [Clostridiales Family XIII bacterium]
MIDYIKILEQNPNGVLATRSGSGVRTRVFQFLFAVEGRAYFCTDKGKQVCRQLKVNPNVSFCTYPPDFGTVLSVNGRVEFVEDITLKTRALDENPMIKGVFKTPGNPGFTLFRIEAEEITTYSPEAGAKTYKPPYPAK